MGAGQVCQSKLRSIATWGRSRQGHGLRSGGARWALRALALALAYFATGYLGLKIPYVGSHITLVWLSAGIAVAGLFHWGLAVWPAVYIGAYLVNRSVGSAPLLAAGIALGNTLGPLLAARWLRQSDFHPAFERRRDVVSLIGAAAMGAAVSAAIGCGNLWLAGLMPAASLTVGLASWWMGDAVGVLLAVPLLLNLNSAVVAQVRRAPVELLLWILASGAVAWFTFVHDDHHTRQHLPVAFLTIPPVVWAALRFGNFGAAAAAIGFSAVAAWSTLEGRGLFSQLDAQVSLLLQWCYMTTTAVTGLLIAALQAERLEMEGSLRDNELQLRRSNQTLALIRECHQLLVYATDEVTLLDGVCRRIAAGNDYAGVWTGIADQDAERRVRPLVSIGIEDEALLAMIHDITWADTAQGQGPTGTAVRTGRAVVMRDLGGSRAAVRGDLYQRLGVNSAISLPLKAGGKVLGAISVYARQVDAFDDYQVSLLEGLADDLAYGLVVLRGAIERRGIELELELRQHAVDSSSNGIMITAVSESGSQLVYVNPAFERITGYAGDEVLGRSPGFLTGAEAAQEGLEEFNSALRANRPATAVLRHYRKDGSLFWCELSMAPVCGASGQATHFIGILNDVTDRVNYETQLQHLASHDELTGLANRHLLADRLGQAITYACRSHRLVAVMLLDLDRFKVVNDSLGHGTGDSLLKVVADRLSACARPGDTVARLGGDEFVVVMADVAQENDVAHLVRKVLDVLAQDIRVMGHDVVATASLGIALYPRDGEEAETLLKHADVAMYRAKEMGRNSFQFYTPEMNARTLQRLELEGLLRRALERNELVLLYQPKVELEHGRVVGAEALIRWRHPRLGMVSPAEFIPLAEETGLIVPIGDWVIQEACKQLRKWQDEGMAAIGVAVNLSARQFGQEDLPKVVAQALRLSGVDARCLELELTESAVMKEPQRAVTTLIELKRIGVRLSLDDFGTGYSSLNYLKRFPIDALKIDQSFVRDIPADPDDAAIAVAVISLAHGLRLGVVAEGVETEEQLAFLRRHGCDEMQGYYFSRPLPADQFAMLMHEGRGLSLGSRAIAATASELSEGG